MGMYLYRITAKRVDTMFGPANVLAYAYKPYGIFEAERNAKLHFKSGCVASEQMVKRRNHTGLAAQVNADTGDIEAIYRTGDWATIADYNLDDKCIWRNTMDIDQMPKEQREAGAQRLFAAIFPPEVVH